MVLPVGRVGETGADHIGDIIGRIAQRTGLPVDQSGDPSAVMEQDIVEPHVAVGDGQLRRFMGDIAGEPVDQLLP